MASRNKDKGETAMPYQLTVPIAPYTPHDNTHHSEDVQPITITLPCDPDGSLLDAVAKRLEEMAPNLNINGYVTRPDENNGQNGEIIYLVPKAILGDAQKELEALKKDGRIKSNTPDQDKWAFELAGNDGPQCGLPTHSIRKTEVPER